MGACVWVAVPLLTSSSTNGEGSPLLAACLFRRIPQLQFVNKITVALPWVLRARNSALLATNLERGAEWPWLQALSGLCQLCVPVVASFLFAGVVPGVH